VFSDIKSISVSKNDSIAEALKVIDKSSKQIALVIDDKQKLLGTITDGDIRRELLAGGSLCDSVEKIYFRSPVVCRIGDSRDKIYEMAFSGSLKQIPILDNTGIVVGLELFEDLLRSPKKQNKVVLMVGGLGTRLGDITKSTPKPMLKVGDRPILENIIYNFAKHGFTEIVLSVNYLSHIIENYFGDGSKFGVSIEYVHEKERMGTAGALSFMRGKFLEPFFVMNGDILTDTNFEHLYNYHFSSNALGTMCVKEYDFQVPYGVVSIDNGCIKSIEEKPVYKFFVSAGIYMLSPEALDFVPDNKFYDMPTLFEQMLRHNKNILPFPIREYWLDIGRLADFERANCEYKEVFGV